MMATSLDSKRGYTRFLLTVAGAVICLGILPVFEKLAVDGSTDRFSLALQINLVALFFLFVLQRKGISGLWRHWRSLLIAGGLGSGIVVFLNITALDTVSAAHRGVFQSMYPAATAMASLVLLDERLHLRSYLVISLMTGGAILMSMAGAGWRLATGDILLALTVPLIGLSDVWARKSLYQLSPHATTLGRFVFGTVVLLVLILGQGRLPALAPEADWYWILLAGFSFSLGIILLYRGMQLRGATLAAGMVAAAPVLTLGAEGFFLQTHYQALELAGAAAVITGGVLLSLPYFQQPYTQVTVLNAG